jgi:hypothetical protein
VAQVSPSQWCTGEDCTVLYCAAVTYCSDRVQQAANFQPPPGRFGRATCLLQVRTVLSNFDWLLEMLALCTVVCDTLFHIIIHLLGFAKYFLRVFNCKTTIF